MTIVLATGLVNLILAAPDGNARSNSTGSATVFSVDLSPSSCVAGNVAYTTQLDCAFYTAKAAAISRSNSVTLVLGNNYYPTCAELVEPTGFYTVDIVGQSIRSSFILKTCSTPTSPVIAKGTASQSANLELRNFTIQANRNANSCMDLWAVINGTISDIACNGVIQGSAHMMQFGDPGNFATGGFGQSHVSHIDVGGPYSVLGTGASITANTVDGRVRSYTVNRGGTGYVNGDLVVLIYGYGTGVQPCTVMPTATASESGGTISAVTPVTNGSGCSGTVDVQVANLYGTTYALDMAAFSDNYVDDIVVIGAGTTAGIHIYGGNNTFSHLHPTNLPLGILNEAGNNHYDGTECDTIYHYCIDFEDASGSSVVGTNVWTPTGWPTPGMSNFYFGPKAKNVTFGAQASLCSNGVIPSDYHEFITQTGPYDSGNPLPAGVSVSSNDETCANIGNVAGFPSSLIGRSIPSASTIALTGQVQHITGTTAINTITAPNGFSSTVGGCVTLIADGAWTTRTSGNIKQAITAVAGVSYPTCYDGSKWYFSNTGSAVTIASGTATLGTSAIASGTCDKAVTVAASGVVTTDNIEADFGADPTWTTGYAPSSSGMLTIIKYPTFGNVNFKVCNNTANGITPGHVTLNWRVVR